MKNKEKLLNNLMHLCTGCLIVAALSLIVAILAHYVWANYYLFSGCVALLVVCLLEYNSAYGFIKGFRTAERSMEKGEDTNGK